MASKAEDDLAKVKQLLSRANSQSTPDARQTFYEHLISICAYPSYDCKAFFGTLVAKHFREFEDLQDKAIDAILDLCEDDEERIRIIGIRGLGTTAKADSRWVRGNVGVLLQLLECPPRELRLIHEQLYTLLSISPSDVIAVMLDDMRANEDTGASRKNIIAFLTVDALPRLVQLFESGENADAEETLQKGLENLLPSLEPPDQSSVLVLLGALPAYSGRASGSSTKSFVKLLTRSIKHGSSAEKTGPYVHAMAAYVQRNPPLVPLDGLFFAGDHGTALVQLCLEKRDEEAVRVVEQSMEWVEKASRDLGSKDGQDLAGDIVDGYLRGIKYYSQDHKTYFNNGQSRAAEMLLYTLYQLFLIKDNRRDMISKSHRNALLDLGDEARKLVRNAQGSEQRQLESINELVKVLENDHKSLPRGLVPSWKAQRRASPPRSLTSTIKKEPSTSSLRSLSPPRSQPFAPRAPAPSQPNAPLPAVQAKVEPSPIVAPAASSSQPTRPTASPKSFSTDPPRASHPTAPLTTAPTDQKPSSQELEILSARSGPANPAPATQPAKPPSTLSLAQRISGGQPVFNTDPRASLSGTELLPGPPTAPDQPAQASNTGVELLPALTRAPDSSTSNDLSTTQIIIPVPLASGSSQPKSLMERMGLGKRPRDDAQPSPSTPGPRSLIDRMSGPLTDTRTPKRPREDVQPSSAPVNGTRSLLSRMSSGDMVHSPSPPLPSPSTSIPAKPSMSIRQTPPITNTTLSIRQTPPITNTMSIRQTPPTNTPTTDTVRTTTQSSIDILRRASRHTPTSAVAPRAESTELFPGSSSAPAAPQSINIRSRASQPPAVTSAPSARPVLSIRSSSGGADAEGVRRKGRGFLERDEDGDIIMERPSRPEPSTNGHGQGLGQGLAGRLGARAFGR